MLWKRKSNKIDIKITFDKKTNEIKIVCEPVITRPTEIIQILMLAINIINQPIQEELEKEKEPKKKRKYNYIG